jgi:hypothetical protein
MEKDLCSITQMRIELVVVERVFLFKMPIPTFPKGRSKKEKL